MSLLENLRMTPSVSADDRRVSHAVFILAGFAIILGGLWLLYQSNAPYHPDLPMSENHIYDETES